ncbi:predicted protein [Sclerotinia sclerotiorum 1980 UF-70]|uniref:Uncharacterized protein n=1 Tax=Sclerotinia sclerotiorum (strain ATCC 18683 / 1980 / Ss-1) TaxID=665079 RepID=A7F6U4_SCLS1|nr:predicted protein [Sclerotinia sclerotiorum 1980 UF-70]EDN98465.1 predicted protein [Sclerotinia sclerotiorum 1980 UF-70]
MDVNFGEVGFWSGDEFMVWISGYFTEILSLCREASKLEIGRGMNDLDYFKDGEGDIRFPARECGYAAEVDE